VEMDTGMPRKYYSITQTGLEALEKMKTFWSSLTNNLTNLI